MSIKGWGLATIALLLLFLSACQSSNETNRTPPEASSAPTQTSLEEPASTESTTKPLTEKGESSSNEGVSTGQLATHYVVPVYPTYETLQQLTDDTSVVVQATVVERLPAQRMLPQGIDPNHLPSQKAANIGWMETEMRVRIEHTFWTNPKKSAPDKLPEEIIVSQTGGSDGQNLYIVEGHPLSEVGETYIFFLTQVDQTQVDQKFVIVGGAQGHFAVKDGKLVAFREKGHPTAPIIEQYDGVTVAKLRDDLNMRTTTP